MAVVATGTKIPYVPLNQLLHTIRIIFVGAKPKQSSKYFLANSVHRGSRQRLQTLGLWCGDDPAEYTVVIHTPWATSDALDLVKIRWGDE